ncbi:MAG TPA: TonB-dependent receptor plug domain-containing protein [Bacteroidales bacterium]|mgnify:CR=1 FL=1|jgi:hypothetical protein|nr:TonB-dependent receptor plug domain-containing protein [Bacteroidales bacterium]HPM86889.1 TonB-dependent receptor plug domain-containing protein [Bacteroidales bacterium]HQM68830.1 TonB-dependent receptor plug domain-containing protein [Bacteroidales bacterium]
MYLRISVLILLSFLTFSTPYAQKGGKKIIITGTVLDENNNPAAQAEIFADGESTGNFTGYQGRFKIRVPSDIKVISAFSETLGYGETEINGRSDLTLKLDKSASKGQAGNTGKTGTVDLSPGASKKMNTYTDIYQMIRHEVTGVVVSGRSIMVQGPNSFFGSSQPLFVVNGVRVNSIDNINPLEVKSIKLLKGSAANIYGNDGANGVIVIDLQSSADKNNQKK